MSELEIRNELKDKGVVGVHRVSVRKNGEVIPTSTLFLTLNRPDLPQEIKVGYIRVKVEVFVPDALRCFNCNRFDHTTVGCKTTAKCVRCAKEKHNVSNIMGLKLAPTAVVLSLLQPKIALSGRWRKTQRIRVEESISFTETRQLVEAKTPAICSQTS